LSKADQSLVLVGRVTSVFGIKGWVNVYSYTDPVENILQYPTWLLSPYTGDGQSKRQEMPAAKSCTKVVLSEGQRHGKKIIAQLSKSESREQAAAFIQQDIFIYRSELPELDDEVYWFDLHGLQVVNQAGQTLGKIKRMMATGANDVMVVECLSNSGSDNKAQEVLIPYVKNHYILDVNLDQGKVLVDWELD
jgi:16S rRNA processing protein RimM